MLLRMAYNLKVMNPPFWILSLIFWTASYHGHQKTEEATAGYKGLVLFIKAL